MSIFSELGLSEPLLRVLPELGFESPSPIQQQSIPLLISEPIDFIGLAQTGTGKTAAFGLPLLDHVDSSDLTTQALIIAPTRELCQQIAAQLVAFAKYYPNLRIQTVYGGAPIGPQIKAIKAGVQIIVATPGRLIDLIDRKVVKIETIDIVVLDEADEMLNMGFKEDIDAILSHTPEEKATWLFSATMPREIRSLIKKFMKDPVEVSVQSGNVVNTNIEHQYAVIRASDKAEVLRRFIDFQPDMLGIVFCRTKIDTQNLAVELTQSGYHAEAIHGDLSQQQRDQVMKKFKAHAVRLLIATDVAARGIDVSDLSHVIHYSLPDDSEYYTHRSGRTARAGKTGISLALITHHDIRKIRFIEKKLGIGMKKVQVPAVSQILNSRLEHWADKVMETEVNESLDIKIHEKVVAMFAEMNQETLLAKLLSRQMELIGYKEVSDKNLNDDRTGDRGSDRGNDRGMERRGDRRERDGRRDRNDFGSERRGDRRDERPERRSDRPDRGFDKPARPERPSRPERSDRPVRSESSDRPVRSERRERTNSETGSGPTGKGMDRFFINIGSMDQVNKGELLKFICDQTKLRKDDIGQIQLNKSHSFFEVDAKSAGKVANSFKGLVIDGRELRVNKDEPKG
ncbi:MAG: DEAD/DEAH box helicase [Imperialibacter sp.]|uniref:DEAD/DEAH box helicase n=1 Tax=Imperialibacter sp. TaxID=2038411 RepID=UPI0032F0529C